MSEELFTTTMKKATRKVHGISDALINAKLLFALNNDRLWAEGLLIFYEIFKFLENAMTEKRDENLGKLYIPEMSRTSAFEADLNYYLGNEWKKNYKMKPSVENYLKHLNHLLQTDSDLLMPYVYHLYMGVLSGGQIISKKRQLTKILKSEGNKLGEAVTDFSSKNISKLKTELREKMNSIAEGLDENKKALLVNESVKVFELNNSIVETLEGVNKIAFRNGFIFLSYIVLIIAVIYYYNYSFFNGILGKLM